MVNLILAEASAMCLWVIIALICGKLMTGYLDIFVCVIGMVATALIIFRIMTKKEASHEFIKKIEDSKIESINKKEELEALNNKEILHFPGMQKGEIKNER